MGPSSLSRAEDIKARFTAAEKVLFFFSKDPATVDATSHYSEPTAQWGDGTALTELRAAFPGFDDMIHDQRVLDYGCGDGFQSVAMARQGAKFIMGVDISQRRLAHARQRAGALANIAFADKPQGLFDLAISLNSFEHFPNPAQNLDELAAAIRPGGKIMITFGSPWLSPYGSHMNFFTHFPWVNIVFSEKTVFNVRQLYRHDSSRSYFPDMNKMTAARFEKIITASHLQVSSLAYEAVRNLPLTRLPWLRELFINRISCVLIKPS